MSGAPRAQYMRSYGGALDSSFFTLENLKGMSFAEIMMMLPQKTKNEARSKKWSRDDLLKVLINPSNIPKIICERRVTANAMANLPPPFVELGSEVAKVAPRFWRVGHSKHDVSPNP